MQSARASLTAEQFERYESNLEAAKKLKTMMLHRPRPPGSWQQPPMPDRPTSFDAKPMLPAVNFLATLNPHPRDLKLQFFEDTHTYLINGVKSLGSVTGLVHQFAQPFIPDVVIARMIQGKYWPRVQYFRSPVPANVMLNLYQHQALRPLWNALSAPAPSIELACNLAQRLGREHPHLRHVIHTVAMNADEIKLQWQLNAADAANRGTWMHWTFEAWLNYAPVDTHGPEFAMFLNFVRNLPGLIAYRTEWTIFADAEALAGSIDFVAVDSCGDLVLFDWKRTKQLQHKFVNRFQDPVDCHINTSKLRRVFGAVQFFRVVFIALSSGG
jgi:hypothetical protein